MVYLYTGTPGSGKSLHVAEEILSKLMRGGNVVTNIPMSFVGHKIKGRYVYVSDEDIRKPFFTDFLYDFAFDNHEKGKENQTLIVFDEAQRIWSSRMDRLKMSDVILWEDFFSLHRHIGYNVVMCTQNDRMLQRYIRSLAEYEVKHRKINNWGFLFLLPFKLFLTAEYWYGVKPMQKMGNSLFVFRKKYGRLYDSYVGYDQAMQQLKKRREKQPAAAPSIVT